MSEEVANTAAIALDPRKLYRVEPMSVLTAEDPTVPADLTDRQDERSETALEVA